MTGTAKTEEKEFTEIYDLHVVEIPTNEPVARDDQNDLIFRSVEAKFNAVLDGHRRAAREGAARSRRHDRRRDLRVPGRAAQAPGHPAQRPEREAARARGGDHQGRRRAGRRHDRDEHGRPRRRHQARRRRPRGGRAVRARPPRGTRRGESTTSFAADRAARATRASRASTSRARTTSCACSPATGSRTS